MFESPEDEVEEMASKMYVFYSAGTMERKGKVYTAPAYVAGVFWERCNGGETERAVKL